MQLGWIGTGILGSAIIKKLSETHKINAWNRTQQKLDELTSYGIKKYKHLNDLARDCQIVFLCLSGKYAHRNVIFGIDGLANNLMPGSIVVDISRAC